MKTQDDWYNVWKKRSIFRPKIIWLPYSIWYNKHFNFNGKLALDFGSSKKSNFFKKFLIDNVNKNQNYKGYDIDKTARKWLMDNNFFYDFWNDNSLKGEIDLIYCSHVYEHLDLVQREKFIERSNELLIKNGILIIDIPHIANLNIIEFFRSDRTHKPVSREDEALYIELFGFECEVYLVGFTMPYKSVFMNFWNIIRNMVLGFYPQLLTIIVARNIK